MTKRIYGLETEYALAHDVALAGNVAKCSANDLYAALEVELLNAMPHAVCDPTRPSLRPAGLSPIEICEGYFLANGARIYLDTGHLEWAAPETSDPYQAIVYDRAADMALAAAAASQERIKFGQIMIVKNNIDYQSNVSYGCHENYSVRHDSKAGRNVLRQVVDCLVPFLVTRQILCGAGRLGAVQPPHVGFQLSQRADFMTCTSSVKTREDRPIVNLRDEPLADERAYARLHLILGDSNMAEVPAFLKLGMTGILLDMIEADAPLPRLSLPNPADVLHQVSRDLSFQQRLPLVNGGTETALGIQRAYWQYARDFLSHQSNVELWERRVIALWGEILDSIEHYRQEAAVHLPLDWAIKYTLLSDVVKQANLTWDDLSIWEPVLARTWKLSMPASPPREGWEAWLSRHLSGSEWAGIDMWRREHRLSWNDYPHVRSTAAKLRVVDIRYHDIDLKRGLFYACRPPGAQVITDTAECETAQRQAPANTRAAVRSAAIQLATERGVRLRVDWNRLHLVDSNREVSLPDPLSNDTSVLRTVSGFNTQPPRTGRSAVQQAAPVPPVVAASDEIVIEILEVQDISLDDDEA